MIARPARARLQSLCGTARRMRKEEEAATASATRRPCRHPAVWACHGNSERLRRSMLRR
ncbi:MAG TPA: hypothetical protein VFS13_13300 [Steroidobacteraceae bacterium]|nr:hypothetical protein [Steroidobacteraceae bacterium]